jgi:hypothetical protein
MPSRRSFLGLLGFGAVAGPAIIYAKPLATGGVLSAAPGYIVGESSGEFLAPWRKYKLSGAPAELSFSSNIPTCLRPMDVISAKGHVWKIDEIEFKQDGRSTVRAHLLDAAPDESIAANISDEALGSEWSICRSLDIDAADYHFGLPECEV